MKKEESHIIKEILNGKTEQYEYFLDRYGQQVFVLVDRIVSCQEDAEELTQDVFLKAFQQLSSFKAESSFSTWIYRIATNIAISAVRKKRNDVLRLDDSVFANLSDTQVDAELEDESEEQMERLQQAMNQLEADERALITLYYLEEKPLAEVAFILGMTEGNAKVKLHRIRKKLYVLIKNNEPRTLLLTLLFVGLAILIADQIASGLCKPYFQRLRPTHDPLLYSLIDTVNSYRGGRYGFFSSHASNTFAIALFLTLLFRKLSVGITLFSYAVICSYSRLYLGVHFPTDILAGVCCGLIVGLTLYLIYIYILRKMSSIRNFYSSAYTKTGYLLTDLQLIPLGFSLTLVYVAIKAVVFASQL